jgi:hypothetical protein
LKLSDSCISSQEALTKFFILLTDASELEHYLVKKVIDFILVVALTELSRLKALVYYVFWS